jgi:hypothetical protein
MSWRDAFELASLVVTVIGLPFAIVVFVLQQRKERENEEEEAYQHLSDAYNGFLRTVLTHSDLQLRTARALSDPTPEQRERLRERWQQMSPEQRERLRERLRERRAAERARRGN